MVITIDAIDWLLQTGSIEIPQTTTNHHQISTNHHTTIKNISIHQLKYIFLYFCDSIKQLNYLIVSKMPFISLIQT